LTSDLPLTPRSGYSRYRQPGATALPLRAETSRADSLVGVFPRKTVLVVIGVIAVMALIASFTPSTRTPPKAAATPAPAAADVQTDPDRPDVVANLNASGAARTVQAELGDRVLTTVTSRQTDSVALGTLDTEPVEPGVPASFSLLADTPGSYPLVTLNDERTIGVLKGPQRAETCCGWSTTAH